MEIQEKTVALIFGGEGQEHDISVMGADFVRGELIKAGYAVLPIFISTEGEWLICEGEPLADAVQNEAVLKDTFPVRISGRSGFLLHGELLPVQAAFPLLHGELGEDGVVQGALRCAKIPFVGCDTVCGAVACDKAFTKLIANELGVPTVEGFFTDSSAERKDIISRAEEMGFPVFIKPTRLGSSVGAGIARGREEAEAKVNAAAELGHGRILVERFIEGARELECAVMRINGKLLFTNIGEIFCKCGFYDYDSKYAEGSKSDILTSADITPEQRGIIKDYSGRIAEALGVSGLSRIDFFMDPLGNIYFNEINTMPGMTAVSMFPRLAADFGFPMPRLLRALIEEAL